MVIIPIDRPFKSITLSDCFVRFTLSLVDKVPIKPCTLPFAIFNFAEFPGPDKMNL